MKHQICCIETIYKGYCICRFSQYYLICKRDDIERDEIGNIVIDESKCIPKSIENSNIAFGMYEDARDRIDDIWKRGII